MKGGEDPGDCGLDAFVVSDTTSRAAQGTPGELAEEGLPEGLCLGRTISMPRTSRRPTQNATITATNAMRPARRTFTYVAPIHRYGKSPSIGRSRKAVNRYSISSHSRFIWLLEMPVMPMA